MLPPTAKKVFFNRKIPNWYTLIVFNISYNSVICYIFYRMASCSDGELAVGQLEELYLRLHRLVLFSTRVLRAKFDDFFPPDQLKIWSPSDKDLKKAELSDFQIRQMKSHRHSSKFDISLLISLLRNFCYTKDKMNPLWNELDNDKIVPSLQCEVAQIVRIRNLRNKVRAFFT